MGIEIRPVAVQGQLDEKFKTLSSMLDSINQVKGVLSGFSQSGSLLSGDGYDAARAHMGQYEKLLDTLEESVRLVREADTNVKGALNDFGGAARVSEDEWRDKKDDAEKQISSAQEKIANLKVRYANLQSQVSASTDKASNQTHLTELSSITYGIAAQNGNLRTWQANANEAGEMLSKIYAYCEKTNGAYEGTLQDATAMAANGAAQFASCSFGITDGKPSWGVIDESSWFSQEIYDAGSYVFDKKGFGEVCDLVIANPTVDSMVALAGDAILDWWDENGWWVSGAVKVGFGLFGIAAGILMCASGVGAPAGAAVLAYVAGGTGILYSVLDTADGVRGLYDGKEYDWQKDFSRSVATAFGADPDAVEMGVKGFGLLADAVNVGRLPANIGSFVDSSKALASLPKVGDSAEFLRAGFGNGSSTGLYSEIKNARAAVGTKLVDDAENCVEGVNSASNIIEETLDEASSRRKDWREGYGQA